MALASFSPNPSFLVSPLFPFQFSNSNGFLFECDLGVVVFPYQGTLSVSINVFGLDSDERRQRFEGGVGKLSLSALILDWFGWGKKCSTLAASSVPVTEGWWPDYSSGLTTFIFSIEWLWEEILFRFGIWIAHCKKHYSLRFLSAYVLFRFQDYVFRFLTVDLVNKFTECYLESERTWVLVLASVFIKITVDVRLRSKLVARVILPSQTNSIENTGMPTNGSMNILVLSFTAKVYWLDWKIARLQLCFCATEFDAIPTKSGKVLTFGYYPYKLSSTIGQDEFSFCPAKQYGSERNLWTARLYHVLELTSRFSGIVSSNQLVYEDISICILLYGIFILAVNVESSYKICFGPKLQVKISCCIDSYCGGIADDLGIDHPHYE
ncbi:hypothetical protein V6N13_146093 [Hibiscus sabdariffa]|uniref:Uncharacterized protein n=1 Tax=Hibiscus sabdariffa TaxID=183260 RepID=A0ABR2TS51_9ROSI